MFCWTDKLQRKHLTLREGGKKTYRLAERYVRCFVDFAWSHDSIWISRAFLDWGQKQTNQKKEDQHAGDQSPQIPSVSLFSHSRGHLLAAPCAKRVKRKWHCEQFAVVSGLKTGAQSKVVLLSLTLNCRWKTSDKTVCCEDGNHMKTPSAS